MENKFYNIVKRAYNNNELLLLLSADEAYIRGNDWIKPDPRLSMGYDRIPLIYSQSVINWKVCFWRPEMRILKKVWNILCYR